MLQDYYDEVKAELAELRQEAVDALIGATAGSHDTYAGRIRAIDDSLALIDEVMIRYNADEADAEGKGPTRSSLSNVDVRYGLKGKTLPRYARGRA